MKCSSCPDMQQRLLGVMRIVLAFLFLQHGTAKLFGFPHVGMFDGPLSPLIFTAGLLEVLGGFMLLAGFMTRKVSFVLSGLMAAAYFIGHMGKGFLPLLNGGELAVVYCFVFLFLSVAGGGAFSLDNRLCKKAAPADCKDGTCA